MAYWTPLLSALESLNATNDSFVPVHRASSATFLYSLALSVPLQLLLHVSFSLSLSLSLPLCVSVSLARWRKSWGQGGNVPSKVLTGGTAVLTVPPKFKLRRDTAGSCFVGS